MGYLLGIDVGTTRTAAATGRPDAGVGDFEIVNLGDRASSVPSVLYIGDDGSVLVGAAAERRSTTDPGRVVREFKRRIGDPTPVMVGGRPWAPEELSARLVRWVVDRVAEREGGPADRIAVTHPASWGAHKKDRLGGALAAHGIPVTFLAEPQAAALHYAAAERLEAGSTIAVYDLGGGTFDAAVVHKDGYGFTLTGRPEGLERLGGIDFDEVVFEHVRDGLPGAFEGLDETDPGVLAAVAAIRRECTEAKEALSSDTEVSIPVLTPAAQGSVRLHRSEFEAMIRPRVEETVDALRRAVTSAGLVPGQLSAVLLVGGSSRIPLVAELVSEQLGRPVAVDADPKNAIAKGAALSLHPVGVTATGAAPARVPNPRDGAGSRHAAGTGAVPWYTGPGQGVSGTGPRPAAMPGPQFAVPPTQRLTGTAGGGQQAGPPQWSGYPQRPGSPAGSAGRPPEIRSSRPPTRSPTMLVSIGGVSAAAAVIATLFLLPSGPSSAGQAPTPVADVPTTTTAAPPPVTTTPIQVTTTVAPPAAPAPPPRRTTRRTTQAPPPPPPTTDDDTPTTEPPTSETTTTTTTSTSSSTETSTSESPPPESGG